MSTRTRLAIIVSIALAFVASGCSAQYDDQAAPRSSCAFVVNDGKHGRDAEIDKIYYPGQTIKVDSDTQVVHYVYCNARNLIVNDGTILDANNEQVGDRLTPTIGYTSTGTKVLISWKSFWTPNQDPKIMERSFYPFCAKYPCYSTAGEAGKVNNSTEGWNDMLGENNMPASDSLLKRLSSITLTDASWQEHDTTEWAELAKAASAGFAEEMRPYTGFADDIFCGSGDVSGWEDPDHPGEGEFTCGDVRFVIDEVVAADPALQDLADRESKAEKEKVVNEKEYAAAQAKYGSLTGYWLGLMDALEKCSEKSINCKVNFGEPRR